MKLRTWESFHKNFSMPKLPLRRSIHLVMTCLICVVLFFSSISPAFAIGSDRSNPREGTAKLNTIQEKSEEALKNPPNSMESVQDEANQGLNEIQGSADIEDMNRPSNSQQATSVEEQAERAMRKITGKG